MVEDIYDPLSGYTSTFRDKFEKVVDGTFSALADGAQVDVGVSREMCRQIYVGEKQLMNVSGRITMWTILCVILWIAMVAGGAVVCVKWNEFPMGYPLTVGGVVALLLVFLLLKVHPKLESLHARHNDLDNKVKALEGQTWSQMAALNRLYDWGVFTRMISRTVPRLEFDPYFVAQRLADLRRTYEWNNSFSTERSVLYFHSGLTNSNPFIVCRTRKMEMGGKTYHDQKTIFWTTTEAGPDGKPRTVSHSETLHASVTAPYPNYFERTRLIYSDTAAPGLTFYRKPSGLAGKRGSLRYKWDRPMSRRKARNLENSDSAMLTNEEFEVAFNTSNHNNNQQYALLFTPLTQQSLVALLMDKKEGYGDDFGLDKHYMINTTTLEHLQVLDLDMNPTQCHSFDFEKTKKDFYEISERYFRAIYFSFAPLLCVLMYQQIRPQKGIYGHDMEQKSSFWEHEALANFWGQENFQHPDYATPCIMRTSSAEQSDGSMLINVTTYGFHSERRMSYIGKYGGDSSWYDIPVEWYEFLPVEGNGRIMMQKDETQNDTDMSQKQRMNHINEVLRKSHLDVYRRHIASKI